MKELLKMLGIGLPSKGTTINYLINGICYEVTNYTTSEIHSLFVYEVKEDGYYLLEQIIFDTSDRESNIFQEDYENHITQLKNHIELYHKELVRNYKLNQILNITNE